MSVKIKCSDGKKRAFSMRGAYRHLRSEKAVSAAIASALDLYRSKGQIAYADALEKKGIVEQMCLLGIVSH